MKHAEFKSIKQLARFVVNSEPKFEEWKNHEIRVKTLPTEDDFRTARIDLNKGFSEYWDHLVCHHHILESGTSRHRSPNNSINECSINTTESRDELMKKSFEATLKWIVDTDYLASNKPKMITTSPSLYLLLQLPYEDDDVNYHVSWLVTKFNGILYLFALENDPTVCRSVSSFSSPTRVSSRPSSQLSHSMSSLSLSMSRSNLYSSSYNLNSSSSDLNTSLTPAQMKVKNQEMNKFRIKSFTNLITEQLPTESLHSKHNKMIINEASFDDRKLLYCAQINGVNNEDEFVDIRLSLPNAKKTAEYWLKLQKYWAIAVTKPSSEVIIGRRSKKPNNKFGSSVNLEKESEIVTGVPDGRLVGIDRLKVGDIPYDVADFSCKSVAFDIGRSSSSPGSPLWEPLVSYDFLKRFIEFIDKRVMDDASTVYKLTPEGYYGRGYSVLGVQKLSLRGCLPLVPEWYVNSVRQYKFTDDVETTPAKNGETNGDSNQGTESNGDSNQANESKGDEKNPCIKDVSQERNSCIKDTSQERNPCIKDTSQDSKKEIEQAVYSSSVSTVKAEAVRLNGDRRNGYGDSHHEESGHENGNGHEICDVVHSSSNEKEIQEFEESELLQEEEIKSLLQLEDDLLDEDLLHINDGDSSVTCQVTTTTTVKVDINHERHVVQQSININEMNLLN